jgi:hypothetical protein
MNTTSNANDSAAEWKAAQVLYPMYAALAREFVIDIPALNELETGTESPSAAVVQKARQWFLAMDERIQVHQLRHFLQTTNLTSDNGLQLLLEHHLHKSKRSDADRDKVDFLLVQYFSQRAPSRMADSQANCEYVAKALEPVLGKVQMTKLPLLNSLEELIKAATQSGSLNDLLVSGILERGRKLKVSAGENYFQPVAMVAFTRFSFMMRRAFFRLMHQDLNAILDGLRELEHRNVTTLDCRAAQFSSEEPIMRLRMICQSWKVMFHAEYSSGQPLRMLVDLHTIVNAALEASGGTNLTSASKTSGGNKTAAASKAGAASSPKKAATPARAKAAAAGAGFAAPTSAAPEFEISSTPQGWDPDGSS